MNHAQPARSPMFAALALGLQAIVGPVPGQDAFPGHSRPGSIATGFLSSYAFFSASDGITGTELWRTNGNPGGAQRLTDIRAGRPDSAPRDILVMPGDTEVYFTARDASTPSERRLYRHQVGTSSTTVVGSLIQPTDLVLSYASSGAVVYLIARVGSSPPRIYSVSSGVATMIPGSNVAADPYALTAVGPNLYFAGRHTSLGIELFRYVPGSAGPTVIDIAPGAADSSPSRLTAFSGELWCAADRTPAIGRELCCHGVSGLTVIDTWVGGNGAPDQLAASALALWFTAYDGTRRDLCFVRSDKTWGRLPNATLTAIEELTPVSFGGGCWFRGRDNLGTEPWATPDTATIPSRVADLNSGSDSSRPRNFQWTLGGMVYRADDGTTGAELYRDSTRIHDLRTTGTGHAHASPMVRIGWFGNFIYAAEGDDPNNAATTEGRELWSWDGSGAPVRIDNIKTGLGRQETTGVLHDRSTSTDFILEFSEFGPSTPVVLSVANAPTPPIGLPFLRGLLVTNQFFLPVGVTNAAGQLNLTIPNGTFAPSSATLLMQGVGFGFLDPSLMITPPTSSQPAVDAISTGPITVQRECLTLDDKTGEYRVCLTRTDTFNQPAHIGLVRYSQPVTSGPVTRTLLEVRSIDPGQTLELEGQIDLDANETSGPQADRLEIRVYSVPPSQSTVGSGEQAVISYC